MCQEKKEKGLVCSEECIDSSKQGSEECIKKSKDYLEQTVTALVTEKKKTEKQEKN